MLLIHFRRLTASREEYLANLWVHMSSGWGQSFCCSLPERGPTCHYKDVIMQINSYSHNAPINVFLQKGCGGYTLGLDQQKHIYPGNLTEHLTQEWDLRQLSFRFLKGHLQRIF